MSDGALDVGTWAGRDRDLDLLIRVRLVAACSIFVAPILACAGELPSDVGRADAGLAACPSSPNCVSSHASDAAHRVEVLELSQPPDRAWPAIQEVVAGLPRSTIVESTPTYLHAECTSLLFRFVDDLELRLQAVDDVVEVRSASRVGFSDMGVNRRRVEGLRELLRVRGVVR